MNQIEELHDKAMEAADEALLARRMADEKQAEAAFTRAYEWESMAARLAVQEKISEPSRSVLLRSAATFALDTGRTRQAEQLAAMGLVGDPPPEIADELRDLLQQAHFHEHLEHQEIVLSESEIQLSITGESVGVGIAPAEEIVLRIQQFGKLTQRTMERLLGRPYREGGRAPAEVLRRSRPYLSTPRAGSFAVSIRLGEDQSLLSFDEAQTSNVIEQVLNGLESINQGDYERLSHLIAHEAYRRNFIGLARELFPEGKDIRTVGITALHVGRRRTLQLDRAKRDVRFPSPPTAEETGGESSVIFGRLVRADKFKANEIGIEDQDSHLHKVEVPEGMMADIVRPLWEETVEATIWLYGGRKILQDIAPWESE